MKQLLSTITLSLAFVGLSASAAPSITVEDIAAKKVEMRTDAVINDYCLFGKTEQHDNFVICTQMIGDMSKGVYKLLQGPLTFSIPGLSFTLLVDPNGLEAGELTYIFAETDVENPLMKPSEKFFDQVKEAIATYGPANLGVLYIGPEFDSSLFGTPVPLFQ